VGEKGYNATTIADIAQRGSVSLTTFYCHFDGKEEAALAALRRNARGTLAATLPAYQEAPEWQHAVGRGLHALCDYLSTQPAPVQLGFDAYADGPEMVGRRDDLITDAQAFLAEGYRQHPQTAAVAAEAVGASINELLYGHLRRRGVGRLYEIAPTAVYIALAPFLGSDMAGAVANESAERRDATMRSDQLSPGGSDQGEAAIAVAVPAAPPT
jgi:AcrR family transcriptional regulator